MTASSGPTGADGTASRQGRLERWRFRALLFLASLAAVWTLQATYWVTMPVVAAFFLALAVWPICRSIRAHVPARWTWLGYVGAMLVLLAGLAAFLGSLWFLTLEVTDQLPRYAAALTRLSEDATNWIQRTAPDLATAGKPGGAAGDKLAEFAAYGVNSAMQALSTLALILFLTLLMLMEAPLWRAKLADLTDSETLVRWTESLDVIARRFRQFAVVSTGLGLVTGGLYVAWLSLFGLELLLLWGLLAYLLNYVPMIGSAVALALPVLMTLVQADVGTVAVVALGLLVIEQVMGNLVAPRVQGKQLTVSPLMIMVTLALWSWIWGIAGAVLATPIAVLMTIIFDQMPRLRPWALVLSDQPDRKSLGDQLRE